MTITSPDNPALKEIRRLQATPARARSGHFVAEGEDLLAAADEHGWVPLRRLAAEGSGLSGDPVLPELLDAVSTLGSGVRTIAIYEGRYREPVGEGIRVHLEGLKDPGNVGTIVRSAHALGAISVSIGSDTCDPFAPKAVRASMGSIFAIPIERTDDPLDLPGEKVALVAAGGTEPAGPIGGSAVLITGSERSGLPESLVAGCERRWTIPVAAGAESLNAAVATSIALHCANRIQSP